MEIHIGQLIKKRLQETGMSKTEFARRINKTSQNVYDIFERKTIDTGLLYTISTILDFNFFEPYSLAIKNSVSLSVKLNDPDQPLLTAGEMVGSLLQLEQKMNEQTLEISALKKEIAYLMEINGLLSGRRKIEIKKPSK
jgi:plasmid maintenance system antidote protein VapI